MTLRLLYLYLGLFALTTLQAQTNAWTKEGPEALNGKILLDRATTPSSFQVFSLNLNTLKQQVHNAPLRMAGVTSSVIAQFPNTDGELTSYRIYYAPVMQPGLAARNTDMRSYTGVNIANPAETIRFSITPYGLHNITFDIGQTAYTDPYTTDLQHYIVYKKQDVTTARTFRCATPENTHSTKRTTGNNVQETVMSTDGTFRVYRLAMACTVEYAAFHINAAGLNNGSLAQKKAAVLAAMNVTMTRVNGIYERDFAITMQLVDTNENVIFINSDIFDNSNTDNALLNQSQGVIDQFIGFDNYDIGHVVSTGGGGVAQLWSPCSDSKARGITGLGAPVGDSYDVDYVAHEMGHQFGGNHTFNNECGGNRSDDTSYEPGSGTTIMAYAGVCDPNVEFHSDAHFHAKSIQEMSLFIAGAGDCGVKTVTGNIPPAVDAGKNYTIPFGTPFILQGSATDANNDVLTYCWEQYDKEISVQPPVATATVGPNFRSLPPKEVPQRYMPDINAVLSNNLYPTWEVTSNVARTFTFALTVRDNNMLGGQVVTDMMNVNVAGTAGPFVVTAPNTNVAWQAATNQTVTWNVAGTTANGVNTPYVDIYLSTNGGQTYPTVLALKVPNDGSEIVTVPNVTGGNKRIMVKGHDNIFYDLGNANFNITAPENTMAIAVNGAQNITGCKGNDVIYTLAYNAYSGFNGTTTYSVTGNPTGSVVTFSPGTAAANGTITVTVSNTDTAAAGFYSMTVTATSGSITKEVHIYLDLLDANFGPVVLTSPAQGATAVSTAATFDWQAAANASAYQVQVATDAQFGTIVAQGNVTDTEFTATLLDSTQYFWRVSPANAGCAGNYSEVYSFTTGLRVCEDYASADVPVEISDSNEVTITSNLNVDQTAVIESLTITMDITHTWVSDLTATLISPQGTEVQLFSDDCWQSDDVIATFSDQGQISVCDATSIAALSGLLLPDEALSAFVGESASGQWQLRIEDGFGADGGNLNSWSLNICTVQPADISGLSTNLFDGFALYPNPNNGNFMVRFNAAGTDAVAISVYDMRGRRVVNQSYTNTGGLFEQNIALPAAQQGIYLVNVQQGSSSITKKIMVK
jgi:subtilisin-like proprotein convertase family protein